MSHEGRRYRGYLIDQDNSIKIIGSASLFVGGAALLVAAIYGMRSHDEPITEPQVNLSLRGVHRALGENNTLSFAQDMPPKPGQPLVVPRGHFLEANCVVTVPASTPRITQVELLPFPRTEVGRTEFSPDGTVRATDRYDVAQLGREGITHNVTCVATSSEGKQYVSRSQEMQVGKEVLLK